MYNAYALKKDGDGEPIIFRTPSDAVHHIADISVRYIVIKYLLYLYKFWTFQETHPCKSLLLLEELDAIREVSYKLNSSMKKSYCTVCA